MTHLQITFETICFDVGNVVELYAALLANSNGNIKINRIGFEELKDWIKESVMNLYALSVITIDERDYWLAQSEGEQVDFLKGWVNDNSR